MLPLIKSSSVQLITLVTATLLLARVQTARFPSQSGSSPRIVGGLPANDAEIPYIVSLVTYGFHSCGGSIVNERTVLTAAHCLVYTTPRLLKVHAGAKTRSLTEGVLINVKAIHYNEKWNMDTMDYDIGLVRLSDRLTFSATIQPIALPSSTDTIRDGSYVTVSGWGYTSAYGPGSQVLRYARVPIVNQTSCNRLFNGAVTDRMICAGYAKGGIDACQMDSGGPLIAQQKLIGIVSWGISCAMPNKPGVYTRVTELLPWIEDILTMEYNEVL